jgi:hypothetical protein
MHLLGDPAVDRSIGSAQSVLSNRCRINRLSRTAVIIGERYVARGRRGKAAH